ncbi:hypothetical protein AL036_04090 [Salipiger aestuarii]|uniref:Sulphur transport domain-containing protein n=1 Tax=Salipiger aestuarii TaxID=568098 RepID=A0A327YM30_9RHOB|nr:DUF6691 family protein [Salipiger aestuarii]EIE50502.1 YeeE/YedE family protein [Citreicella sp. 357]KAA8609242.1 hypothetical protein AL036_04090 [Salipiger aestuarii]KAA8615222.1 hypothetical protein AL037_03250 [Salipiger aestuarii]KAB2542851.1 hypothetical protein AL035_04355 [Salipiger aestuarii]RAK20765.1 hypothetical protein ATI53_100513 [Salipiger aestuarii]
MARLFFAFLAGGLFGAGLLVSGMTDAAKVQGWLDVFGAWDPTLAFVMGGAIVPMAIAWRIAARRRAAMLGSALPPKPSTEVDRKLVIGSVLFGVGWGLAGLCPGPSIALLGLGAPGVYIFVAAMLTGMILAPRVRSRLDKTVPAE